MLIKIIKECIDRINGSNIDYFVNKKINQLNKEILDCKKYIYTKALLIKENQDSILIKIEQENINKAKLLISYKTKELACYKNFYKGIFVTNNGLVFNKGELINPFNIKTTFSNIKNIKDFGYFNLSKNSKKKNYYNTIISIKNNFIVKHKYIFKNNTNLIDEFIVFDIELNKIIGIFSDYTECKEYLSY